MEHSFTCKAKAEDGGEVTMIGVGTIVPTYSNGDTFKFDINATQLRVFVNGLCVFVKDSRHNWYRRLRYMLRRRLREFRNELTIES